MFCKSNEENQNFNPNDIDLLREDPMFVNFSKEDLLVFYHQYKDITNGKTHLDKENFVHMLNSLNVNLLDFSESKYF